MALIMVMLRFTLNIFQLNLTLNMFHIQTPIRSNQLMIIKCTISCNSSTQNMMMIFWMLTSKCFRLYWWSPLLQNFIQYLLCCFINTENQMLQSQISCHTFLCFPQPNLKMANGNTKYAQGIGIILCRFPKCSIIYPVGPFYYYSCHPSNTIS